MVATGKLDGKVALVTGGGRGQGRSHALTLARAGADIVVCDVAGGLETVPYPLASPEDLAETARSVEALGRRCVAVRADVRSSEELGAVADGAMDAFGRIDVLCANAGISTYGKSWELSDEMWDEVIGVNLTGAWKSCRAVIPYMISSGRGGAIVLTSSVAGLKGLPGLSHYAATKHGLVGLMRSLAYELAGSGIRVNSIHPTGVNTTMVAEEVMQPLVEEHPEYALGGVNLMGNVLLEPQDVSDAVLWLVSDEARYITGVALPVDAGALVM